MPTSDPGQLPPYYRPCNVASVRAALTATALEAAPWLWTSLFFRHTQISDISVWFLHDIEIHHDFTVGLTGHFFWLVVYLPLCKNMSSSVGIILPNTWKNKHVPNHQSAINGDIQKLLVYVMGKSPSKMMTGGTPMTQESSIQILGIPNQKKCNGYEVILKWYII